MEEKQKKPRKPRHKGEWQRISKWGLYMSSKTGQVLRFTPEEARRANKRKD